MKTNQKIASLAVLALLLAAPAAHASTLTVVLNPSTKLAELKSVSATSIVLTYPSDSNLATFLKNYSSSTTWKGQFNGTYSGTVELQDSLESDDSHVRVTNMSVAYSATATGNSTALVITKQTNITAWVSGVFSVVNGTVHADLGWRSFVIAHEMPLSLDGREVEVNYVGSSVGYQFQDHPVYGSMLLGMFSHEGIWLRPTLNFSELRSPLSTWTKNYDAVTNTTTFSKTISGESSLFVSASFNGKNYSLSVKSDPSASVQTKGYAVANGDTLQIQPAPLLETPVAWVAMALVALAVVGGGAYLALRSRARTRANIITA